MNEEDRLEKCYKMLDVLNKSLHHSLRNDTMEAVLKQFIEQITSIPWFTLQSQGGIFLVGSNSDMLILEAQNELPEALQSMCAKVPFGRCLCGRAALTGEIVFADCIDERHENSYDGISPHGHYCIPIRSREKKTLGVILLYLREHHQRDEKEEAFLMAIADALAGIIELKQTVEALRAREEDLDSKTHLLQETNNALNVLLRKVEDDKRELEEKILFNVKNSLEPFLFKLKNSKMDARQKAFLDVLESNLDQLTSSFSRGLSIKYLDITPAEVQVANLVKLGKSTKEIAELLSLSSRTIDTHRENIRKKLGINQRKTNLGTFLLSIQ